MPGFPLVATVWVSFGCNCHVCFTSKADMRMQLGMSALGQKRTHTVQQSRSVLLIKITAKSPNDEAD